MNADVPENHRGVKYGLPSDLKQFWIIYRSQIRLYTKGITLWVILALLVLIILLSLFDASKLVQTQGSTNPNTMYSLYLSLSPIITAIIVPMVIGELLPSEFKDRTAYLNLSMPQSKASFYFGKFCAGLTVLFGTYMLAYALITVLITIKFGGADPSLILQSFAVALCGVLACAATTYIISQFLQKKTVIICMVIWFIVLPGIALLPYINNQSISDIYGYLPFFLTDYSLFAIEPLISTVSMLGMFTMRPLLMPNFAVSCLIGIIFTAVILAIGYRLFTRRQL